jgi:hypothetical protein
MGMEKQTAFHLPENTDPKLHILTLSPYRLIRVTIACLFLTAEQNSTCTQHLRKPPLLSPQSTLQDPKKTDGNRKPLDLGNMTDITGTTLVSKFPLTATTNSIYNMLAKCEH